MQKKKKNQMYGGITIDSLPHMGRWLGPQFQMLQHTQQQQRTAYSSSMHLSKKKNCSVATVETHGRTNLGSNTICLLPLRLEEQTLDATRLAPNTHTQSNTHLHLHLRGDSSSLSLPPHFTLLTSFHSLVHWNRHLISLRCNTSVPLFFFFLSSFFFKKPSMAEELAPMHPAPEPMSKDVTAKDIANLYSRIHNLIETVKEPQRKATAALSVPTPTESQDTNGSPGLSLSLFFVADFACCVPGPWKEGRWKRTLK